ncbi:MAG: tail tape measure protein, partial [Muribaculaceae bacterium]|nr:tail tape measure protein [Muribaculaceae bacterium]
GITSALNGLSSIISLFTSWKEKMEEMKREWYIAEIETNRSLRERSAEYAANRSEISDIIKDVELLNWLIETGYAKQSSISVWETESAALREYTNNLRKESNAYDELWSKLQESEGHYEWGNSLNGGSMTWGLKGFNADMIELWYNQGKLSDEAKAYYEAWKDSGKSIEKLIDQINECKTSMREMVMGISFDTFLSNSASALKKMRGDVSELGKFTEDTLAEAILNGFMYRDLAGVLEPLYNELTDAFIDGTADAAYLENWRRRYEDIMTAAGDRLDAIANAAGVDLDSGSGTSQSGKAGSYTAMSQEQGTKLEGIETSIQMHTASIDEKMSDVSEKMAQAAAHLRKLEENTGRTADTLDAVKDEIK